MYDIFDAQSSARYAPVLYNTNICSLSGTNLTVNRSGTLNYRMRGSTTYQTIILYVNGTRINSVDNGIITGSTSITSGQSLYLQLNWLSGDANRWLSNIAILYLS